MSFWGSITGSDGIKKAASINKKAYNSAIASTTAAGDKANALLMPGANYQPAQNKLFDLLGLNGAQGQQNAFGAYQESPEVAYMRDQGNQGALSAAAASGHLGGTRTQNRVGEISQQVAQGGFGDFYSRLRDLYESTKGTAGQVSGNIMGTGNNLANLALGKGQAAAGYAQQKGNIIPNMIGGALGIGADLLGGWMGKPKTTSLY